MMSVKNIGKYLSLVLILVVLLSIPVNAQGHKVNVILDGAGVDMETILESDRIFVPVEALGEKLDFKVEYVDNQIYIIKNNANILLTINSNMAMVNDEELELDVKPLLIDNKQIPNSSLLYMRNMENEDEVSIKIESEFGEEANLIRYHLKSYHHELEESELTQDNALKLANEFVNRYADKYIELNRTPDLYPSLKRVSMRRMGIRIADML